MDSRDYQVTEEDFRHWKAAHLDKGNAVFKLYPKLNHLLGEGKGMATPEEYLQL
jgi:uncharacterized protein